MITTASELRIQDIQEIFEGRILGLKIVGYFSKTSAEKAGAWLLQNKQSANWRIGGQNHVPTDTNYLLGIPRRMASNSSEEAKRYHESQKHFMKDLREAFDGETPLEKILRDIGPHSIEMFEEEDGLPAIVRHMSPSTLLAKDGICHADSRATDKLLSMNLYLSTPTQGGELDLWNWPHEERHLKTALYQMVTNRAFSPEHRDEIRNLLPTPLTLAVAPGDLVIFDTSKVHAIKSFTEGNRISIQSFFGKDGTSFFVTA